MLLPLLTISSVRDRTGEILSCILFSDTAAALDARMLHEATQSDKVGYAVP